MPLCDRVLIIDNGKIVAEGTPDELKRRISGDVITIEIHGDVAAAKQALSQQPGVRKIDSTDQTIRLTVEHGDQLLLSMMRALDAAKVELLSIQLAGPTLDDVFLTFTGRSLRDENQAA